MQSGYIIQVFFHVHIIFAHVYAVLMFFCYWFVEFCHCFMIMQVHCNLYLDVCAHVILQLNVMTVFMKKVDINACW